MRTVLVLASLLTAAALTAPAALAEGEVTSHSSRFGTILFDKRGFVLYAFTSDKKGKSTCYGACAKAWPPYLVKGAAPKGKLLGVTRRKNGTRQVTYAGWPLYYYVGDTEPRQILCQNVVEYGGTWLVVRPNGTLVRD
jgi:predicted lipoprotein with Yx(FWY)xxD motif